MFSAAIVGTVPSCMPCLLKGILICTRAVGVAGVADATGVVGAIQVCGFVVCSFWPRWQQPTAARAQAGYSPDLLEGGFCQAPNLRGIGTPVRGTVFDTPKVAHTLCREECKVT